MTRVRLGVCGLIVALAATTSGCAGGRNSLGTGASACFRALPPARDAVHGKGRLVGVRRISANTLRARLPHDATLSTLLDPDLCVFAFQGTFDPGSVVGAQNPKPGRYAMIAVGDKHLTVVAANVLDRLPTRFRHVR